MAASLAAAIESAFDMEVELVEGHNGIYEVSVKNEVLYTNKGQCSQGFPRHEQIIEQIGQFIGVAPKRSTQSESQTEQDQAQSRALPNQSRGDSITDPLPMINPGDPSSDCGCGPDSSFPSSGAACCDPKAGNSKSKGGSLIKKLLAGAVILVALTLAGISVAKKAGWYGYTSGQVNSVGVASLGVATTTCATTPAKDSLLAELVGEHEAVFALLPCDHEDHTQELRENVSQTIHKLQVRGKNTDLVVIDPSSPVYARLIELHAAESFPCLAVIGTSCASSLISDDFAEERLFAAFVTATSPVSSSSCSTPCGTQSSDSNFTVAPCCPK